MNRPPEPPPPPYFDPEPPYAETIPSPIIFKVVIYIEPPLPPPDPN